MRYAIVSDIHSNLEALIAVLRSIDRKQVDDVICLGDIVGYGANPDEVIELIRQRARYAVLGNHDAAVFDDFAYSMMNTFAKAAITYNKNLISEENLHWLKSLPVDLRLDDFRAVHASPSNPTEWKYVITKEDAIYEMDFFNESTCLFGHTHIPSIFEKRLPDGKQRRLINVGSVGQPRDGDYRPSYGIIDTATMSYENVRVEYDYRMPAEKILAAGLPFFLADRLSRGK
ncbi:MAG: metallophosphoesterase family protein [Candidatus Kryptoniota bacterium]